MNCYYHPERPAVTQCKKCLKGICEDCLSTSYDSDDYVICSECYDKLIRTESYKNQMFVQSMEQQVSFKYEKRLSKFNKYDDFLFDLVSLFYKSGRIAFIIILVLSTVILCSLLWVYCSDGGEVVLSEICEFTGAVLLISLLGSLIVSLTAAWIKTTGELLGPNFFDEHYERDTSRTVVIIDDYLTEIFAEILVALFKVFFKFLSVVFYFIISPIYVIYVLINWCWLRLILLFTK